MIGAAAIDCSQSCLPGAPRLRHTSAMARASGIRVQTGMAWLWLFAGVLATGWAGAPLAAQDTEPAVQDAAPLTLHVYTNLIQTPVLVLGPKREPLVDPIAPSRFSVSIDSGPWFHAAHVRQEGMTQSRSRSCWTSPAVRS
jgi:hypothetical protein